MKKINLQKASNSTFRQYILMGCILAGLWMMMLPSCTHDAFPPVAPGPGDTIINPIDTMDIDTMGEDTMGVPCDPETVYFSRDVLPILRSNCAKSGCHDAISHQKDIILDTYENVMASDRVRPFDLNDSDLFDVITESDLDKRMPQPPNQRLTADQITVISKWILQGARDLTCDEMAGVCDTAAVSYSGFIAPLLTTYCVGCHSGPAPSGNRLLNSHSGVQAVALNGRLKGAITWAPGYQQMPRGSAQLPDCTIDKIKAWINDGALNN